MIKEGIKSLRELDILGWISYISIEDPPEGCVPKKGSQLIPFAQTISNTSVRRVPRSLRSSGSFSSSVQADYRVDSHRAGLINTFAMTGTQIVRW